MTTKSQHLQIRLTPRQKAELKQKAQAAGQQMSEYVLARLLPPSSERFAQLVGELASADYRF